MLPASARPSSRKTKTLPYGSCLQGGPPIVWLRLGNTRRAVLLERVEAEFPQILAALERGDTLIEVA
jgi:hypothetical protein